MDQNNIVFNFFFLSGFSYPNFSMSAANGVSSGVGSGGGKMRRERTRFVTCKPPEEEVGLHT